MTSGVFQQKFSRESNPTSVQLLVSGHPDYRILEMEDFLEMDPFASQSMVMVSPTDTTHELVGNGELQGSL